jgi:hypothetical protein
VPIQGVITSLARVGHAPSVKNRYGYGWRLLDRKNPATIVERHVSWKNQSKWANLTPKKETQTKQNKTRSETPVKSSAEEHQPLPNLIRGNKNFKALMARGHKNSTGSSQGGAKTSPTLEGRGGKHHRGGGMEPPPCTPNTLHVLVNRTEIKKIPRF